VNLIGLDLDGTLEDSRSDMVAAVRRVRTALNLAPRPDDAIRPWVNRGMDQLYRACFDDYVDGVETRLAVVRTRYEADYLDNVARDTRLYPGIADSLAQLTDFGRLAVITNKPERISRRLLEALGVDRFVAAIIGGDTCTASKPDPLVFAEAARRCGFHAARDRAVMVGDTTADVTLGRAVGAATIWCAWGYLDHPGEEPDFVATQPSDLPGLVQQAFTA
jgi:phosphoglycolate phosphatase